MDLSFDETFVRLYKSLSSSIRLVEGGGGLGGCQQETLNVLTSSRDNLTPVGKKVEVRAGQSPVTAPLTEKGGRGG